MASTTIFDSYTPRKDILNGAMSEAKFAARLGPVLSGAGPADYWSGPLKPDRVRLLI